MAQKVTAALIKQVRDETGAGMMDVKKALTEAEGDVDRAKEIIRARGIKAAGAREGRKAQEGLVASQVVKSDAGEAGYAVELNSETDFVAKTPQFVQFGDEVIADVVESETRVATEKSLAEGKPEKIVPKIVEGRLNAFYKEVCLLDQAYVKDTSQSIADLFKSVGGKAVAFARVEVGKGPKAEEAEKAE